MIAACAALATVTACAAPGGTPVAPAASATAPSAAPSATPSGDAPATACRLDDLRAELSAPEGPANQPTVRVVWTNTSGTDCAMTGFGGVDLRRTPADRADLPEPERGLADSISLPRTDATADTVRLAPDGQAHSTITYLPLDERDLSAFRPDDVLVTPPDETRSAALAWTGGAVLRQDGATRPGTYLGPVEPGAA